MQAEEMAPDRDDGAVLYHWSARKLQPIIVVYVAAVFAAMMAVAYFLAHSQVAVKALMLGAVGFIVPLFPGLINKVEYRLTESGLEKRPLNLKAPQEFKEVFRWDQLSHVVPMKYGFKYYKPLTDWNPLRRFWKTHVSDAYSGEFHIEAEDRAEVLSIMARHDIPTSRT
jgi:hypothetical protein